MTAHRRKLSTRLIRKGALIEETHTAFQLIESRLGLSMGSDLPLVDFRQRALRFVLVNEFRADLSCDPPASVAMIPSTQTKEQLDLVRKTALAMRDKHAEAYATLSDGVVHELNLAVQSIDPKCLGKVDTFRFEESALLSLAGELIRQGQYDDALQLVTERKRSFWVDRSLMRQSQWEACRLMARLGAYIKESRKELKKATDAPKGWVDAYCRDDGWHRVDQVQHTMEAWVAKMEEEPENESALETVRQAYEDFLQEMTLGFMESLSRNDWSVGDFPSQTQVYSAVIKQEKTPTAYFLVDAMRYAMASELVNLLSSAKDVVLKPAVGAWPTITPVGMAALLPGAESGFCIVNERGKLAAQVEDAVLPNVASRMKFPSRGRPSRGRPRPSRGRPFNYNFLTFNQL